CAGSDSECRARACINGTCGAAFADAGTPTTAQSSGDCRRSVCDGDGGVTTGPDNLDLPNDNNACTANACDAGAPWYPPLDTDLPADDGNPCTGESCSAGMPTHPTLATNTACDAGVCNASGQCVQCNAPSQCAGADSDCRARTCANGTCGIALADAGIP